MNIYESNKIFIKQYYPSLIGILDDDINVKETSEFVKTRNQEPNLLITVDGHTYYLHSKYNAREESKKWIETVNSSINQAKHIFIMGVGLGYYLEELLHITNGRKDIFIYEPSVQVFKEWLQVQDIKPILSNPKIRSFAVGSDAFLPAQIGHHLSKYLSGSLAFISPPIYEKLFPKLVKQMKAQIKTMLTQEMSTLQTLHLYQSTWLENILFNLPHVINSSPITELRDKWKGVKVKAIVVGSGPSLSKDIHYLKCLKDKCLIIAAGSSIQALEHFGLYPHIVISIDGSEVNGRVFNNIDVTRVPLVFCTQLYYGILDHYKNKLFYSKLSNDTISDYLLNCKQADFPTFHSTGSVTGTAMQLAMYMGIDEIILMGQDLSYSDDQYYAPGVNHVSEKDKDEHVHSADEWVENVEGGRNRTKSNMQVLLKDIEAFIPILQLYGVRVINTSKKGAVIQGTDWISMDELFPMLKQLESNVFDVDCSRLTCVKKEQFTLLKNNLNTVLKSINTIDLKLQKIKDEIDNLRKNISVRNVNEVNQALLNINEYWNWIVEQDAFKVFYNYSLEHYINIYMRYVPEIVETNDSIEKGTLISEHLGRLIEQIITFNPEIINIVNRATERLNDFEATT